MFVNFSACVTGASGFLRLLSFHPETSAVARFVAPRVSCSLCRVTCVYIPSVCDCTPRVCNQCLYTCVQSVSVHMCNQCLYRVQSVSVHTCAISVCTRVCNQCLYTHVQSVSVHTCAISVYTDQISHSVVSDSLRPHESQHARPPCPSPTPGVH